MKKEHVSDRTIRSVFDSIEILHPGNLPRTLCIDEFHAESGFWIKKSKHWAKDKYNVNVTDGERKIVVDVLQQRTLQYLSKYFRETYLPVQRQAVKFFCCDMNGGFISLAKTCFPKAVIIVDNFHVVQLLTKAMDKVRCREQDFLIDHNRKDDYARLKKLSRVLKTWDGNIEKYFQETASAKRKLMEEAFQVSPDLQTMHGALQDFHDIMMSYPASYQKELLLEWINEYKSSDIPELKTAVGTIRLYRSYIINAWMHEKSNGPCEGLNKKIKDLKRSSFGIHSFESFRKRILLTCGGLTPASNQVILHIGEEGTSTWS